MSSLTGKVALITGSSKGIGAAVARSLAARGASCVINYSSADDSDANSVAASLAGTSAHLTVRADISSASECRRLVSETIAHFGRLDILVLSAGWMPTTNADVTTATEDLFDKIFAVNVKGPFFLTQAAAAHLPSDGSGRVVFFSTSLTQANTLTPNYTLYVSTKGAVEQMVRGVSKDLGRRGICVNVVSPGPTGTDLFYNGKSEQVLKTIAGMSPMGRIGTPEEVAHVVGFLAGEEGGWVMGQNWRVNGGFV